MRYKREERDRRKRLLYALYPIAPLSGLRTSSLPVKLGMLPLEARGTRGAYPLVEFDTSCSTTTSVDRAVLFLCSQAMQNILLTLWECSL